MTTRESAVRAALLRGLLDEYGVDTETWTALGSLGRITAAVLAALDTTPQPADDLHRDLVKRLGFGDNITEPMADNDTIVKWFEEQGRDASEWREHELWRGDCYVAGHPDDEDCDEHGPTCCARAHQPTPPAQAEADAPTRPARDLEVRPDAPSDTAAQAEAVAAVERVRARFTSCWCGEEAHEDCPLHGSGLARHMAAAALDALTPAQETDQ